MPNLGETRKGNELGYKNNQLMVFHACPICGDGNWVRVVDLQRGRKGCHPGCVGKAKRLAHLGELNNQWRGGRKNNHGYIEIYIPEGHQFAGMRNKGGRVMEHRLVMAQHLGRPLLKNEQVHHRPDVAKDDNRIEVLYLMPNPGEHNKLSPCAHCELKTEIRLLRWELKELKEALRLKVMEG